MRTEYIVTLAFVGLAAASSLMWIARPSAIPAYPEDIFPDEIVTTPAPEIPAKLPSAPVARAQKSHAIPADPLKLTLEPEPPVIRERAVNNAPVQTSGLSLEFDQKQSARGEIPKIKLFDSELGTRGYSSRRWLSDKVGIEAGIGITDGEGLGERQPAAGAGVVISFD